MNDTFVWRLSPLTTVPKLLFSPKSIFISFHIWPYSNPLVSLIVKSITRKPTAEQAAKIVKHHVISWAFYNIGNPYAISAVNSHRTDAANETPISGRISAM